MALVARWLSLTLALAGCGHAVTTEPVAGKRGAYEIECAEKARCVAKAREVCGERYQVVSEWEHPLAMPDGQPGLRDYPRHSAQQLAEWQTYSSNTGPSDVSTAPPIHRLDVVCVN